MIARAIVILTLAASACAAAERWSAGQFVAYSEPQSFHLTSWGHDGKSLYAAFMYAAIPKSQHPVVSLQISHSWEGPWKTVARVRAEREILQSGRRGDVSRLRVRVGAFEPYLRSYKAGRAVLATGEAGTISLCKLVRESIPGECDE